MEHDLKEFNCGMDAETMEEEEPNMPWQVMSLQAHNEDSIDFVQSKKKSTLELNALFSSQICVFRR